MRSSVRSRLAPPYLPVFSITNGAVPEPFDAVCPIVVPITFLKKSGLPGELPQQFFRRSSEHKFCGDRFTSIFPRAADHGRRDLAKLFLDGFFLLPALASVVFVSRAGGNRMAQPAGISAAAVITDRDRFAALAPAFASPRPHRGRA
jgi:hypothetical protein